MKRKGKFFLDGKVKRRKENYGNVALKLQSGRSRESSVLCFSEFRVDSVVERWVRNRLFIASWLVGRWCWPSTRSSPETSLPLRLSVFTSFPLPTTSSLTTVTITPSIFWLRMVMVMSPTQWLDPILFWVFFSFELVFLVGVVCLWVLRKFYGFFLWLLKWSN